MVYFAVLFSGVVQTQQDALRGGNYASSSSSSSYQPDADGLPSPLHSHSMKLKDK